MTVKSRSKVTGRGTKFYHEWSALKAVLEIREPLIGVKDCTAGEVKLFNHDQVRISTLSAQRNSVQEPHRCSDPEISGQSTSSEENIDLHMKEHSEGGTYWQGESEKKSLQVSRCAGASGIGGRAKVKISCTLL